MMGSLSLIQITEATVAFVDARVGIVDFSTRSTKVSAGPHPKVSVKLRPHHKKWTEKVPQRYCSPKVSFGHFREPAAHMFVINKCVVYMLAKSLCVSILWSRALDWRGCVT